MKNMAKFVLQVGQKEKQVLNLQRKASHNFYQQKQNNYNYFFDRKIFLKKNPHACGFFIFIFFVMVIFLFLVTKIFFYIAQKTFKKKLSAIHSCACKK